MAEDYLLDLSGKTAVVTGGSGVLGGTLARGLAKAGASVVIVGHRGMERAESLAKTLRDEGATVWAVQADVLSRDSVQSLLDRAIALTGHVDFLINAAGGARPDATTAADRPFFTLPEKAVREVFDLNFWGVFLSCQVFSQYMSQRKAGAIINVSSIGAYHPLTRSVAYSAGKAAVTNFTQWLAVHLSQEYSTAIRVNALVPGFFLTSQNRFLLVDEKTGEWTDRGQRILAHTPLGRMGNPEDLVGPALWLLSDAARFVHGTAIFVDGGLSAYGGV